VALCYESQSAILRREPDESLYAHLTVQLTTSSAAAAAAAAASLIWRDILSTTDKRRVLLAAFSRLVRAATRTNAG